MSHHGLEVTVCKSCHKRIFFATSEKGKPIPLLEHPVANGNIMVRDGKALYKSKKNVPEKDEPLYLSHFVDCPNAAQYRTKKDD